MRFRPVHLVAPGLSSVLLACRGLTIEDARTELGKLGSFQTVARYEQEPVLISIRAVPHDELVSVHHVRASSAEPRIRLLLIHGYPDSLLTWAEVLPGLAEAGGDVRALDLPGQGLSRATALPDEDLSPEAQAAYVWNFLKAVGWAGSVRDAVRPPLVVVGHSFGGLVACALAAEHKDAFAGLILIDPEGVPRSRTEYLASERQLREGLTGWGSRWYSLAYLFTGFGKTWEADTRKGMLELRWSKEELERVQPKPDVPYELVHEYSVLTRVKRNYRSMRFLTRRELDVEPMLADVGKSFAGRTLLIWGAEDRLFPTQEHGARFRKWFCPKSSDDDPKDWGDCWREVKDAGHLPQRENPGATLEHIRSFLDGIARR